MFSNFGTIEQFSELSNIFVYAGIALYALSFVLFSADFSFRASRKYARPEALRAARSNLESSSSRPRGSFFSRSAFVVFILAFASHIGAFLFRAFAAGRVPWANMYEFSLTSTLMGALVFLILLWIVDIRFLGLFISGFLGVTLAFATLGFYVPVSHLDVALQSVWLVIHVFVASFSVGLFTISFFLSILQLAQISKEQKAKAGRISNKNAFLLFLNRLPKATSLEDMAFGVSVCGFIFWTFTLIAGAIWAERAWGRYWGWDVKEVWTFVIWVIYAAYLHARTTRGWRGRLAAWLCISGYIAVLFNFGIVNIFFKGLHSYSGLS